MKVGSDNFRASSIQVIVYEPALNDPEFYNSRVVNDLAAFKHESDIIIANRRSESLADVEAKIFSLGMTDESSGNWRSRFYWHARMPASARPWR